MQFRIVLVRPRNPLNILAAARAACNFGFTDVAVVCAHPPVWEEAQAAKAAAKWLRNSTAVDRLEDAIADCQQVLGTSSLQRRRIEPPRVIPLPALCSFLRRQRNVRRTAILFGSEKSGLSNEELSYCQAIVRIPTQVQYASMNLGQAVAVCCYELSRPSATRLPATPKSPAASVNQITRLLDSLEALLPPDRARADQRRERLLRMFLRWGPRPAEIDVLLGVMRDIAWRVSKAD